MRRRLAAFVAIGAVLAAVAVGAAAPGAQAEARRRHLLEAGRGRPQRGPPALGDHSGHAQGRGSTPRRGSGLRGDFTAAALTGIAIAVGIAMRLRRERRPSSHPTSSSRSSEDGAHPAS